MIDGIYSDPNHVIAGSFGGLRAIARSGDEVVCLGCDDGENWWTLLGKFSNETDLTIDFSPKAPRVGNLAASVVEGALKFADGNAWVKLKEGDAFGVDPAPKGLQGVYRDASNPGFKGLRFVSNRLGKVESDKVTILATDDGLTFKAFQGGSVADGKVLCQTGILDANLTDTGAIAGWTKLQPAGNPHALIN